VNFSPEPLTFRDFAVSRIESPQLSKIPSDPWRSQETLGISHPDPCGFLWDIPSEDPFATVVPIAVRQILAYALQNLEEKLAILHRDRHRHHSSRQIQIGDLQTALIFYVGSC